MLSLPSISSYPLFISNSTDPIVQTKAIEELFLVRHKFLQCGIAADYVSFTDHKHFHLASARQRRMSKGAADDP